MNTYYLRCRKSKYPQLLRLAEKLGVITVVDGEVQLNGPGCWDYIGEKLFGDPPAEGQQDTRLPTGGKTDPFIHINVRTIHDLRALTMEKAPKDPELATEFAKLPEWFAKTQKRRNDQGELTAEDEAVAPAQPMRVFL